MNNGNSLWFRKLLSLIKKALDGKHDAKIETSKDNFISATSATDGEDEGEFVISFTEKEAITEVE